MSNRRSQTANKNIYFLVEVSGNYSVYNYLLKLLRIDAFAACTMNSFTINDFMSVDDVAANCYIASDLLNP